LKKGSKNLRQRNQFLPGEGGGGKEGKEREKGEKVYNRRLGAESYS